MISSEPFSGTEDSKVRPILAATVAPDPRERPIRFAYLVSRYPAISHTFIHREVRLLRKRGLEILVASINNPDRAFDDLPPEEQEEAADTFYVKAQGARRALWAAAQMTIRHPGQVLRGLAVAVRLGFKRPETLALHVFYLLEAILIRRWMSRNDFDRLHVHFGTQGATVGLILAKAFAVPLSFTIHGPDEFYDVEAHHLTEKIEAAQLICCIGTYARSQLMKISPPSCWGKFKVAPLGVDTDTFEPRPFRERPLPFELFCVGRLVPAKGQHILLRALALLLGEGHMIRLHLVGDGPDRGSLESQARQHGLAASVVFHGAVNQDRIKVMLQDADAFVLASFAEGIPVALMEAMAMEIPCVSSRITGIPELIRDDIDGLLVAPSDEFELAAAISRLIRNDKLRKTIGETGRVRVLGHYHLDTNVARLASIFREYASSPSGLTSATGNSCP